MMEWLTSSLKMQLRANLRTWLCNMVMSNCDTVVIAW